MSRSFLLTVLLVVLCQVARADLLDFLKSNVPDDDFLDQTLLARWGVDDFPEKTVRHLVDKIDAMDGLYYDCEWLRETLLGTKVGEENHLYVCSLKYIDTGKPRGVRAQFLFRQVEGVEAVVVSRITEDDRVASAQDTIRSVAFILDARIEEGEEED